MRSALFCKKVVLTMGWTLLVPRLVERALRALDREPFYRRIFVLTPRPDQGGPPRCPQAN